MKHLATQHQRTHCSTVGGCTFSISTWKSPQDRSYDRPQTKSQQIFQKLQSDQVSFPTTMQESWKLGRKKTALKTTQRHGNCTAYFWIKEDTEKDTRINLSTHTTHEKVWWMNHQEGSCWQSGLARKKPKALKHLPPCHKTKTMGEAKAKASVIEEIIKIREGANKTEAKKDPLPKSMQWSSFDVNQRDKPLARLTLKS